MGNVGTGGEARGVRVFVGRIVLHQQEQGVVKRFSYRISNFEKVVKEAFKTGATVDVFFDRTQASVPTYEISPNETTNPDGSLEGSVTTEAHSFVKTIRFRAPVAQE